MGPPPNPPPSGTSVLTGTPPRVYPLRGTTSSLAHCLMSGSDTICNSPDPPLAYIVLFRLPLKVFKMRLLGRGFHTPIKGVSFSSPTDVGSHIYHPTEAVHKCFYPQPRREACSLIIFTEKEIKNRKIKRMKKRKLSLVNNYLLGYRIILSWKLRVQLLDYDDILSFFHHSIQENAYLRNNAEISRKTGPSLKEKADRCN